jgi:tRNA isopentenyl-2-thiomethyl-A-37 hydroxylase MiaE
VEITERELDTLNFYRASELHGGLILGHLVSRARDQQLIHNLTRHSAESLLHAQIWSETILAVGGRLRPVQRTYQRRFSELAGHPASLLHFLAATQVFERRVYRHFLEHLRRPGTHRRVQTALYRMIEEERHHLTWVKEWLDRRARERNVNIEPIVERYTAADSVLYPELLREHGWITAN